MKRRTHNSYYLNGFLLIAASVILITLSYVLHRGDLSTAALVISSVGCFITGIFMFTLSGGEHADIGFVSLLPVQASINICRISGDLGLKGVAHFIPSAGEEVPVFQFIPAGSFEKVPEYTDSSFSLAPPGGMNVIPTGYSLFLELKQKFSWVPQDDRDHLMRGLKEVSEDIYQFTNRADITWNEDTFRIVLHNFRYIRCCRAIQTTAAPVCCRTNPCPVCSLLACMVCESLKKPCTFDLVKYDHNDLILGIKVITG
jgi:hypothetical protein